MKYILFYTLMAAVLIMTACQKEPKQLETTQLESAPTEELQQVIDDQQASEIKSLIEMVDSSFSAGHNITQYFTTMQISSSGEVSESNSETAMEQYAELMKNPSSIPKPVFEVRDSDKVLLPLNDGQVAAHVVLNKSTLIIESIRFLPKSRTDKLGANQDRFRAQFEGQAVTFSRDNFGLKPWDRPSFEGDVQIDGISGATDICQAALDLLNEQLPSFQGYLQAN